MTRAVRREGAHHPARRWHGWATVAIFSMACGEDSSPKTTGEPPPPPATTTGETATGTSTGDESTTGAQACPCDPGTFCAAPYVPGDPPPAPEAFVCQAACVPTGAVSLWCGDDESCCDAQASCSELGVCELQSTSTTGDETSSTATTSTTDAATSTTDGTTTSQVTSGTDTTAGSSTTGN